VVDLRTGAVWTGAVRVVVGTLLRVVVEGALRLGCAGVARTGMREGGVLTVVGAGRVTLPLVFAAGFLVTGNGPTIGAGVLVTIAGRVTLPLAFFSGAGRVTTGRAGFFVGVETEGAWVVFVTCGTVAGSVVFPVGFLVTGNGPTIGAGVLLAIAGRVTFPLAFFSGAGRAGLDVGRLTPFLDSASSFASSPALGRVRGSPGRVGFRTGGKVNSARDLARSARVLANWSAAARAASPGVLPGT
jgi:hypothetical protein